MHQNLSQLQIEVLCRLAERDRTMNSNISHVEGYAKKRASVCRWRERLLLANAEVSLVLVLGQQDRAWQQANARLC